MPISSSGRDGAFIIGLRGIRLDDFAPSFGEDLGRERPHDDCGEVEDSSPLPVPCIACFIRVGFCGARILPRYPCCLARTAKLDSCPADHLEADARDCPLHRIAQVARVSCARWPRSPAAFRPSEHRFHEVIRSPFQRFADRRYTRHQCRRFAVVTPSTLSLPVLTAARRREVGDLIAVARHRSRSRLAGALCQHRPTKWYEHRRCLVSARRPANRARRAVGSSGMRDGRSESSLVFAGRHSGSHHMNASVADARDERFRNPP